MKNPKEIVSMIESLDKLDRKRDALRAKLAYAKKCLCDEGDFVGTLFVSRALDPEKRDRLFCQFLRRNSTFGFLFILAFADEDTRSRAEAEETAEIAYDSDIVQIQEDVLAEKDKVLCLFLDEYQDKDSLEWVYETIGKDIHFKAYEMVTSLLINMENAWISLEQNTKSGKFVFRLFCV